MKTSTAVIGALVVGAVILGIGYLAFGHTGGSPTATSTPTTTADPSILPGINTGLAPWAPELASLKARLAADSLPALPAEGTVLHIHQHLDLFINGNPVAVPAGIGINEAAGFISPIHVHDTSGIIHVESPYQATFTLGEFFDIWGVRFAKDCIGGYCTDASHSLRVYVNGELSQGDPRQIPLSSHQEISIFYGTAAQVPATIPSSFTFPAGY
jgi:hypothetical protein